MSHSHTQVKYREMTESGAARRWFDPASLPLMLKWSLSISALIIVVMGLFGAYLLDQQRKSYHRQSQLLGRMLVEHLPTRQASR